MLYQLFWYLIIYEIFEELSRVRSHAPSIQSHRGTKVVWPDFSQWASQKNRFALIYFGKIQFLPPCIWNLPFMSSASVQFSLRNEGSSEYIRLCEGRESLSPNFKTSQDPMHQFHKIGILFSGTLYIIAIPALLHMQAELIPWKFLHFLKV